MRIRRIFLGVVVIVLAPLLGLGDDTLPKGPEAFLPESVFEFQPVLEGVEIQHEFILHNRGEEALALLKIESG